MLRRWSEDMNAKPKPMFECSNCTETHRTEIAADECCTCIKCGTPCNQVGYSGKCGHCQYGDRRRQAKLRVNEVRSTLSSAEAHLAKVLSEDRPEKGSRGQ